MRFTEFARRVLGARYTVGQLVFAKVAFDGLDPCQLVGREREIADEMFGGVDVVPAVARRTIVAYFGRDSGKSTLAADYVLYRLLVADLSACGPGDVPAGVVISPKLSTARLLLRKARARVAGNSDLEKLVVAETKDGFDLLRPDRRRVAFNAIAASRGGAGARGLSVIVGAMDEGELFYSDQSYVRTDGESYRAMTPRLLKGGSILMLSTPWGDESLMRTFHAANFGDPKTALVARASTLLMRDHDPEKVALVEAEMVSDPDNAKREFFCALEGLAGSTRLFDPQTIDAAVSHDLVLPLANVRFDAVGVGWDLALVRDSATQVVVGRRQRVCMVASLRELRPAKGAPLKLSKIVGTFNEDLEPFPRVRHAVADGHAREPAREYADQYQLRIRNAPEGQAGKAAVYLLGKKLFAESRAVIPYVPRLIAQLKSITVKQTPGGGLSITAPRRAGAHGDICSALVLALWDCEKGSRIGVGGHTGGVRDIARQLAAPGGADYVASPSGLSAQITTGFDRLGGF